ncbi:MAG TPA: alpha-galactosidase, partial [Sediminibacterium sp.]
SLEDGSYAVGLFNTDAYGSTPQSYFRWGDETAKQFNFDFSKAGLTNRKWKVRDLWRQRDLGEYMGYLTTQIPYHGVMMLRMTTE